MSLIPNENLRNRSDYPGDDCQRYIEEISKLKANCNELVEDAKRYAKLRFFMGLNSAITWEEVCNLAGVACYTSLNDFNSFLDNSDVTMPTCSVALAKHKAMMGEKE